MPREIIDHMTRLTKKAMNKVTASSTQGRKERQRDDDVNEKERGRGKKRSKNVSVKSDDVRNGSLKK